MKYLILIKDGKTYLYDDNIQLITQKGGKYSEFSTAREAQQLWEWIEDYIGWLKQAKQDIIVLATENDLDKMELLIQQAKKLQLEQRIEQPTGWREKMVWTILRLELPRELEVHYEEESRSFILSNGTGIKVQGLYENCRILSTSQKPKAIRPKNNPLQKEDVVSSPIPDKKNCSPAKPINYTASYDKSRVEIRRTHKEQFSMNHQPVNPSPKGPAGQDQFVQWEKQGIPEATDEQRRQFLRNKARHYVLTVEKDD